MVKSQEWPKDKRLDFMTDFRVKLKEQGLKARLKLDKKLNIIVVNIKQQDGSFDKYAVIGPTGAILQSRNYTSIHPGKTIHHKSTPEQTRISHILEDILKNTSHKVRGYGSI